MPFIFISEDDLISIFWFITREQFYSISQVNGQFDFLSDKFLERYPEKQVDMLRIKAVEPNENGQENQQQLIDNRLFIQRRNKYGVLLMDEKEIPFASVHNYPKIGKIGSIQIMAPLQKYALKFLQCCKPKFNPSREVHFASFDALVQSLTPDQLAIFSTVFYGFRFMYLRTLPTHLDAFGQFLNISGVRTILVDSISECQVEPFVEWLTQNPLKQMYSRIYGHDEPELQNPYFKFKNFDMNVAKLLGTKCRQVFNNACKRTNASIMPAAEMCPYYSLRLMDHYSSFALPSRRFRIQNPKNGHEFLYENHGDKIFSIKCKPIGPILASASRTSKETKIWVDFE